MAPLAEAAERLGVSDGQVRRLIANGELRAEAVSGVRGRSTSRPWTSDLLRSRVAADPSAQKAAWRRLQAVGDESLDLDDLPSLAVQVRRRSHEQRFRILPFRAAGLRSDSAVVHVRGRVQQRTALLSTPTVWTCTSDASDLAAVVDVHGLRPAFEDANVVVRIVEDEVWQFGEAKVAPLIVCALDSFERLDRRAAHEALVQAQP